MFLPKVSIIIAVKNAKEALKQTLETIRQQNYPHLEVVVIDGNSEDGTQTLLKNNSFMKYVSEPDKGISDAFNKGLRLVTGDYIYFQGAGDKFLSNFCIKELFENVTNEYKMICGRILRTTGDGKPKWITPRCKQQLFKKWKLLFKMALPHQALFTHRSFFEEFGGFDTSVKYAMDYDLLLRAYHQFPTTLMKENLISSWPEGGVGTGKVFEVIKEYYRIKCKNKVAPRFILFLIYCLDCLKCMIKKY